MWKHPNNLFDLIARGTWAYATEEGPIESPLDDEQVMPQALNLIAPTLEWLSGVQCSEGEEMPASFRVGIQRHLGAAAQHIENTSGYSMIPELWRIISGIKMANKHSGNLCGYLVLGLHLLVGSETKYLIGLRGGKPAFKQLVPTIKSEQDVRGLFDYGPGLDIIYLDKSDTDIAPEWPDSTMRTPELEIPEGDYPTQGLLEDAYYNQRYIVNPMGSYVKLRGLHPLVGLTLKLKPGLTDPNYYDFVAVFDIAETKSRREDAPFKRYMTIFDGAFASGMTPLRFGTPRQIDTKHYLLWVVALIYHDLVTARKIDGVRSPADSMSPGLGQRRESPSWVYIPRKLRGHKHPPRIQRDGGKPMTPHHVSGHPRKANLSEAHRLELEKFEAETGLKVLELLDRNPGYTFVRPHISPAGESLTSLPRFIHARLQADIVAMMSGAVGVNGQTN